MPDLRFNVGFSCAPGPLSFVVRKLTRSEASHCFFSFKLAGTPLVLHADHRGVSIESRKIFDAENKTVGEFQLLTGLDACIDELLADLGRPYDYGGLVGQGWVLLGQTFGRRWENPLQSNNAWYCSELVTHFLQEAGDNIPYDPSQVSPGLLMEILTKSAFAIRIA